MKAKIAWFGWLAALVSVSVSMQGLRAQPQADGGTHPTIPIYDAARLTASCANALRDARTHVATLAKLPLDRATAATVLNQFDLDQIALEDVIGPVSILNNVHPDKKVRDAGDDCMLKYSSFMTELFQNEALYERVVAVTPETPAQRQFKQDLLDSFEDNGITLPPDRRKRVKEITDEIAERRQAFSKNIRDNTTKLTFTPEEYKGLPKAYLERVPKDDKGNIIIGFDYPDVDPFMANSENEAARQRLYSAFMNRGTPANLDALDRIVALRKERATLYGLPSHAHYVTKRQMVQNPETVQKFLADVGHVVTDVEKSDLEELRKLKAEMTGRPLAETKFNRWDLSFYSEKLRARKYNIDQESLRKYFPTNQTIEWLLHVSERLYGIRFTRASVPVWHDDVRYFEVKDAGSGAFLGSVYLDLFPRDGKYTHAAAWPVRGVSTRVGRTPISVLVTNFDRKGLTHDELETFFHEFGHCLHGVLSQTEYLQHAGTNVQRDFVEAPSQMYEEWTRRLESLATIKDTCPDCPVMDRELVDRLNAARRFGRGVYYARQHLYASYDMALAGEHPGKALDVWKQMEGATPLGYVPDSAFPGTFDHIAGGYAAGYYGYMWSEVLALDMVSAYGDNIMNPTVGRRFRTMILSRGGEAPAKDLVEGFLGRPVSSDAFFAEITGKRK